MPIVRNKYDLPWGPWGPWIQTTIIPKLEAIAAVIFRSKKVRGAESEKIIMKFATTIDEMIAKMKYPSVFRSYICSSVDRSNLFKRSFQRINIFLQNIVVSLSSKIL